MQSLQHYYQPRRHPRMDPRHADIMGNLEPSLDVYPNMPGAVVRNAPDGQRELAKLLWGMPTPAERVKGKADYGTTNIRNPQYGHWQQYVGMENRCVVPVTSFAEPSPTPNDKDPEMAYSGTTGSPGARTGPYSSSRAFGRAGRVCGG